MITILLASHSKTILVLQFVGAEIIQKVKFTQLDFSQLTATFKTTPTANYTACSSNKQNVSVTANHNCFID